MYELPENLDIYTIDTTKQDLMNYIEQQIEKGEKKVIIDCAKTEDLDAAGLQILVSAYKTAKNEGLNWKIINQKELVSDLLLFSGGKELWRGSEDG